MEGRQVRRFARRRQTHTLLPLRVSHLSNTLSYWYCDFKTSALNEPLFHFGRRHARCLKVWFSVGIGFSLTALLGVSMILLWESARALHLYNGNGQLSNLLSGALFGVSPSVFGWSISLADVGYLCISSVVSVAAHEFGHALAAARSKHVEAMNLKTGNVGATFMGSSEGIQMEYLAMFLAVLFPGALVAFNDALLQALPRFSALRIYCAGVWHNAALCAVCALALFLLPLILYPCYIYGESPMVLDVSYGSPLSGYLYPGDLIVSLDGIRIHNAHEWMEMTTQLDEQTLKNSNYYGDVGDFVTLNSRKGYCVPKSLIEENIQFEWKYNQTSCPNELNAFASISCFNSSTLGDFDGEDYHKNRRKSIHCLAAKDVVKLKKCGDGWAMTASNRSSCLCSEDASCLTPVQLGLTWVEITYSRPYSPECRQLGRNSFPGHESYDLVKMRCGGTFVFIGDMISMAHSILLTSYQPRWSFDFGAYLPNVLEKLLICTFHVSLMLALLNSLPVYFLDGEAILQVSLCYISLLSSRKRRTILQSCLVGGTLICIFVILKIFLVILSEIKLADDTRFYVKRVTPTRWSPRPRPWIYPDNYLVHGA